MIGKPRDRAGFAALAALGLVLFSCSGIQKALTFRIIAPLGGDGLSFASYAGDGEHVFFGSSADCYDAFFSNEYDAVIFDLAKGVSLIQDYGAPFRLARVNTYGNAYLVGLDHEDDSGISTYADIVSWNYAGSRYSQDTYLSQGIQNNLLSYFYGYSAGNRLIRTTYDDPGAEYADLLTHESDGGKIDYAVLPEPYVSLLLSADSSYHLIYDFTDEFQTVSQQNGLSEDGYAHFPQTGLFVSKRWDSSADKDQKSLYGNFLQSYDNMTQSLERGNGSRVDDYLESLDPLSLVASYFGADIDTLESCLAGSGEVSKVNPLGFCSYQVDLDSYFASVAYTGLRLESGSVAAATYSSYYK